MSRKVDWDTYTARLVSLQGATATDRKMLKALARGCVLDAGCGIGIHLGRLMEQDIQAGVGVDVGMIGLRHGKKEFPSALFIAADLCYLPFRDNRFDFVYSIDVVEHLEEPFLALKEYYRVCKPGGSVFIQTPNYPIKRVYDLWHWLFGSRESWVDDPTHVSHFSSFKLRNMVIAAGLQIVSFSTRNIFFQSSLPMMSSLRGTWFGHCFGQKVIIVALKS
jgi:ubiquinone/menaquinone biosynthesis C-methylase UbiE